MWRRSSGHLHRFPPAAAWQVQVRVGVLGLLGVVWLKPRAGGGRLLNNQATFPTPYTLEPTLGPNTVATPATEAFDDTSPNQRQSTRAH